MRWLCKGWPASDWRMLWTSPTLDRWVWATDTSTDTNRALSTENQTSCKEDPRKRHVFVENISITVSIMPDLFSCTVVTFSKWRPHLLKLFCIIKWACSSSPNRLAKSKCLNCITFAGSESVIAGSLSKLIFNQIHKSSELHFAQCSSESLLDSQLQ